MLLSPPTPVRTRSRRQALMGTGLNIGGGASDGSGSSSDGGIRFSDSDSFDSAFSDDVEGATSGLIVGQAMDAVEPGRSRALSDGAAPGGYPSPPMQGTSPGTPGVGATRMSSTDPLISTARGAVTTPPSPTSR
ncbi:unnamed protein product, partial [Laminaria digitata]